MKAIPLVAALAGLCFTSSAGIVRLEGAAFRPATNAEIVWSATNTLPRAFWIYKVMPEAFSAAVISNAMALGQFQMKDLAKPDHPPFQDKYLIYFQNRNEFSRPRFLLVAPTLGAMKYVSQRDYSIPVKNVPTSGEAETLARDVLFQLGIDRSLLSGKVQAGYDETATHGDRQGHVSGPPQVVSRGVAFARLVDGIPLSQSWCFLIHFGDQGRIEDFSLHWRNILPSASRPALSAGQMIEGIKFGQSVLPPQHYNLTGLDGTTKFRVIKATPRYYYGAGREPLEFLFPYAELEMKAEMEGGNALTFVLQSPILPGSTLGVQSVPENKPAAATGRNLIPNQGLDVLEKADNLTLLSLNPEPDMKATNAFYGYRILGDVQIRNKSERAAMLNALYSSIALEGPEAICFSPRHGIHAKMGTQVEDLVICFECGQVYFHGMSEGKLFIGRAPETSLNRILSTAHIPISK